MRKYIFAIIPIILLSFFFLAGCQVAFLDDGEQKGILSFTDDGSKGSGDLVCNKPYIRYGAACCLDLNDNSVCDRDEGLQGSGSEGTSTGGTGSAQDQQTQDSAEISISEPDEEPEEPEEPAPEEPEEPAPEEPEEPAPEEPEEPAPEEPEQGLTVFVTSSIGGGNLNSWTGAGDKIGLAAGDAVCNHLAANAGLDGYFKAWLSNSTTNAKDRFSITNKAYYRVDGEKIADNMADLLDGEIAAKIEIDENNVLVSDVTSVWTMTSASGIRAYVVPGGGGDNLVEESVPLKKTCDNWQTSSAINKDALYGKTTKSDRYWTEGWNNLCNKKYHLYCFEDQESAPEEPEEPAPEEPEEPAEEDPCEGVSCSNTCDGKTRKSNGQCVDGNCQYATEVCGYACSNGACVQDPCEGVDCSDVCDAATRKSNGQCVEGECQYETEECDYGCDAGVCEDGLFIFLTSSANYASFGIWTGAGSKTGIEAADAVCNHLASNAGLDGYFYAWLSDSTINAKDRFSITNKPYYRVDKQKIADNMADLLDGSIALRISITETGDSFSTGYANVWTGTTPQGLKSTTDTQKTCLDWMSYGGGLKGNSGSPNSKNEWWVNNRYGDCATWGRLYCVEDVPLEYYCEWSWPQKVINKNTKEVIYECSDFRPYCNKDAALEGKIKCCKKTASKGYYDCYEMMV